MGFNIGDLFGKAEDAAKQGMNDILQQGGNAALGFLEQKAIDVLNQDKAQKETQIQGFVSQNLQGPPAPGSFGAYMSNVLQSPVLKQYGGVALIGVCTIAFVSILIARK